MYKETTVKFYPDRAYYLPKFLTLAENGFVFRIMVEQSTRGRGLSLKEIKKLAGKSFDHLWKNIQENHVLIEKEDGLFYLKCLQ
jgi:hypothetical protein